MGRSRHRSPAPRATRTVWRSPRLILMVTTLDGWAGQARPSQQAEESLGEPELVLSSGPAYDLDFGIGEAVDLTMREPGIRRRHIWPLSVLHGPSRTSRRRDPGLVAVPDDVRGFGSTGLSITGRPVHGSGYVESPAYSAEFRRSDRELTVGLTADAPRYDPGAEAKVTVTTRDRSGKPVPATVVLRGLDEKLFAMGMAEPADPLAELYSSVPSGILTTYRSHREPIPFPEGGDTTGGGGDEGCATTSAMSSSSARSPRGRTEPPL